MMWIARVTRRSESPETSSDAIKHVIPASERKATPSAEAHLRQQQRTGEGRHALLLDLGGRLAARIQWRL
jgi:hypothetical protein